MPAWAASLVINGAVRAQPDLVERIAKDLLKHGTILLLLNLCNACLCVGLFERAGDFFEKLGMPERALDAYRRGSLFRRAVELARREFPDQVVSLEDAWGDYCMMQHQPDVAVKRYVEAGKVFYTALSDYFYADPLIFPPV